MNAQIDFNWLLGDFVGSLDNRLDTHTTHIAAWLQEQGVRNVLDVSGGYHDALLLADLGFDIDLNEVNDQSRAMARKTMQERPTNIYGYDWREISKIGKTYDALISCGNSFPTYLFSSIDREKSLDEFTSLLNPEGILIIDHRNYDKILTQSGGGEVPLENKRVYTGDTVSATLESITPDNVRFRYDHKHNGKYAYLDLAPAKAATVRELLQGKFPNVKSYVNYCPIDPNEDLSTNRYSINDFVQHIATRKAP